MTRGPVPGGPNGHGARCRCSTECRDHTNQAVNAYRARQRDAGYIYHHGQRTEPSTNPTGQQRTYDYDQVARHAIDAIETGHPIGAHLAAIYGIGRNTALNLVAKVRNAGYPIPPGDKGAHNRGGPGPFTNSGGGRPGEHLVRRAPVGEWADLAECRGVDPDLFHPARGESTAPAKAVCAECLVRAECLDHAIVNKEKQGVWGGKSERERRAMRRERRLVAA